MEIMAMDMAMVIIIMAIITDMIIIIIIQKNRKKKNKINMYMILLNIKQLKKIGKNLVKELEI